MELRYLGLVKRHLDAVPSGAAGCDSMPSAFTAFADTMGAWRFYNNPRISFAELIEPLRESARQALAATGAPVVMLDHDWCKLSYPGHTTKKDQAELNSVRHGICAWASRLSYRQPQ